MNLIFLLYSVEVTKTKTLLPVAEGVIVAENPESAKVVP